MIFLFILSTTSGKLSDKSKNHSQTIDKINVVGLSKANNLMIMSELNGLYYQNIFLVKKSEINKIISKHNTIEEFSVKKIYPAILNINIKPTKFVAKVSGNNQQYLGANGKIITSNEHIKILPYIFGEFNSKEFLEFKTNIDSSQFKLLDLKAIYFFPSSRWDILTFNNILIKLPQKNLLQSLSLAHKIINNNNIKNKNLIDLRVNGHLTMQ